MFITLRPSPIGTEGFIAGRLCDCLTAASSLPSADASLGVDVIGIRVDVVGIGLDVIGIRVDVIGTGVDVIGGARALLGQHLSVDAYDIRLHTSGPSTHSLTRARHGHMTPVNNRREGV
eukprot:8016212-Pyramimonas_sp.AAC.1